MGFNDDGLGAAMGVSHQNSRLSRLESEVARAHAEIRDLKGYIVRHRQQIVALEDEISRLGVGIIAKSIGTPFSKD